jgi:hypothetical protein
MYRHEHCVFVWHSLLLVLLLTSMTCLCKNEWCVFEVVHPLDSSHCFHCQVSSGNDRQQWLRDMSTPGSQWGSDNPCVQGFDFADVKIGFVKKTNQKWLLPALKLRPVY